MLENQNAIEACGVSMAYRRYTRQVATLKQMLLSFFRGTKYEMYWALQDLDLAVPQGQRLGVVGPNGSGKSTLLKAIAAVLPPTKGTMRIRGRVAPLIELGGGFNAELTGRENIYLNGAIMGVPKQVMEGKIAGIIEFADLGDFIDAPLTTYSSGMKARLGFAVATDVDPEILLLDEIFSVGDAEFRAKARARIEEFFKSEKTVVLVSHELGLVERLCDRAVFLEAGRIVADGKPAEVIAQYENRVRSRVNAKPRAAR